MKCFLVSSVQDKEFPHKLREVIWPVKDYMCPMEDKQRQRPARSNLYSMLSASACQLASMIFSETPTVPHLSF